MENNTELQPTNVHRIRSIPKCIEMLKQLDAECPVSSWNVRRLCKSNEILSYNAGTKILVDYDNLLEYFNLNDKGFKYAL